MAKRRGIRFSSFSHWLEWPTRDGVWIRFKMPHRVFDALQNRLWGLFRDREVVRGHMVTGAEVLAAMKVAIALVICHQGDMRPQGFCLDPRAISREGTRIAAALKLSPWLSRRAREILEFVGFIDRQDKPSFTPYRVDPWTGEIKQKPTVFFFGRDFLGWLYDAIRHVKFGRFGPRNIASQMQEKEFTTAEGGARPTHHGSRGHLRGDRTVTLKLEPRWIRDRDHRPVQIPLPET